MTIKGRHRDEVIAGLLKKEEGSHKLMNVGIFWRSWGKQGTILPQGSQERPQPSEIHFRSLTSRTGR